jgi:hypothetical protein
MLTTVTKESGRIPLMEALVWSSSSLIARSALPLVLDWKGSLDAAHHFFYLKT